VKVNTPRELMRQLAEKRNELACIHRCALENRDFVLETYVGGTEHTVDMFVCGGEPTIAIVSDKFTMRPPYFVEEGDVMPSMLPEAQRAQVVATAEAAARALGVHNGWTHTEIKLSEGEAYVMEIAARMGGGYIREMVAEAYGLDMERVAADLQLGGPAPRLPAQRATVIGREVVAHGIEFVARIRGLAWLAQHPHVRILTQPRKRRGVFHGAPYSYCSSIFSYFVVHPQRDEAMRVYAETARRVRLDGIAFRRLPRGVDGAYRRWLRRRTAR